MRRAAGVKRLAGVLAICFLPFAAVADTLTERARSLIEAGKGVEAYRLLEPQEAARAGEPAYDLLLGIAAIDAGQGTRAIFALERVLAVDPNNARARAEIGRAYMAVGEAEAAKTELDTAKKQGVPPEVAATIDKLISAIDRTGAANRTAINGFVEATVGYDSNVNAAPNRSSVAIPGLGGLPFVLSANSRNREDTFGALGAGLTLRQPLGQETAVVAGVAGNQRWNSESGRFNTANLDAYASLVYARERDVLSLTAQTSELYVASDDFRNATGVTALWQHNVDARNQFSAYAQYSNLQFSTQPVRDADRYVAGAAWAHAHSNGMVAYLSGYLAQEKTQKEGVSYLGHDAYGLRTGAQWGLDSRTTLFGSLAYENRRYGGTDPAFLVRRKDQQLNLNLGVSYAFSKDWLLIPQLSWTNNDSNTQLNEYHRETVSVTIRREF